MQTNAIKRFATEARNKLKEGIAAKIRTLGFDQKGIVVEDIDRYLEGLRQQLLKLLVDHDGVMITK